MNYHTNHVISFTTLKSITINVKFDMTIAKQMIDRVKSSLKIHFFEIRIIKQWLYTYRVTYILNHLVSNTGTYGKEPFFFQFNNGYSENSCHSSLLSSLHKFTCIQYILDKGC